MVNTCIAALLEHITCMLKISSQKYKYVFHLKKYMKYGRHLLYKPSKYRLKQNWTFSGNAKGNDFGSYPTYKKQCFGSHSQLFPFLGFCSNILLSWWIISRHKHTNLHKLHFRLHVCILNELWVEIEIWQIFHNTCRFCRAFTLGNFEIH